MKTCRYCAEEIQDEAIKCKHCGEFLDGRPQVHPAYAGYEYRSEMEIAGAAGVFSLGGLSLGLLAFGGVALGGVAAGGLAVATTLALGGAAFSLKYAIGGLAVAPFTIGPEGVDPEVVEAVKGWLGAGES